MSEIPMVNRSLLVIRPKQPFIDWLKNLPDPSEVTVEECSQDATSFLIPDFEDDEERDEIIAEFYPTLFDEALLEWWSDQKDWPKHRDLKMFYDWFQVDFHSLVLDLGIEPLSSEED
jgi:hypothetical protein